MRSLSREVSIGLLHGLLPAMGGCAERGAIGVAMP